MLSLYGDFWRSRALSKTCPIGLKFSEVIYIHRIFKKSTLRFNFSRKVGLMNSPTVIWLPAYYPPLTSDPRLKKIDKKDRKIWYIQHILVFFSILWLPSFYSWIEHFHLGLVCQSVHQPTGTKKLLNSIKNSILVQ
jgi:hypothetical protein